MCLRRFNVGHFFQYTNVQGLLSFKNCVKLLNFDLFHVHIICKALESLSRVLNLRAQLLSFVPHASFSFHDLSNPRQCPLKISSVSRTSRKVTKGFLLAEYVPFK